MTGLDQRWAAAWRATGSASDGTSLGRDLIAAWTQPHRAYHAADHLVACLEHLERDRHLVSDPLAVGLALWFHDAIYDPRADDNETRSAEWARSALAGAGLEALAGRVADLVLATRHAAAPADDDAGLLVDIDLAILGAPPPVYALYEAAVRREYAWVSEADFRAGRAHILRTFVARPAIFVTAAYRQRYEAAARANLATALASLTSPA